MLTVAQYAEKVGCTARIVSYWCSKGLMQGAVKTRLKYGMGYLIPENEPVPQSRRGRPFGGSAAFATAKRLNPQAGKPMSLREQYAFIRRHVNTYTYRQLSDALGVPVIKVREMYDLLHERYGI